MSENVAITINLKREVFEDMKRFALETQVPWEVAAASLIEATLRLTRQGQAFEAEDAKRE
jgi:hypothetical protein